MAFLRADLRRRGIISCAEAMAARNGLWIETAGIVLVRQRPGSARGVMFLTLEDESGIANLVVWTRVFEAHRRIVLTARMIAVTARVQREGEVVHLVVHGITDLSWGLASVGEREESGVGAGGAIASGRARSAESALNVAHHAGPCPRDMYVRDLHLDTIRVKPRDFR